MDLAEKRVYGREREGRERVEIFSDLVSKK